MNTVLSSILNALETPLTILDLPLKAIETNRVEDCVCYTFYNEDDNGRVRQDRLELRIIATALDTLYDAEAAIKDTLVSVGDIGKISGIQSIEANGGGLLIDNETKTVQLHMFFTIISKSEVKINGR